MESLWRDVTLAARTLRRTPGFTMPAIVMLAVGIGAATAVFSIVHAALLRPFAYVDTDRWATLHEVGANEGLGAGSSTLAVSVPNYRDWKRESQSFLDMALYFSWTYNLSGEEGEPERAQGTIITPHIFDRLGHRLGLTPAAGRLLREGDEAAPHDPDRPIMISYELWQRRFGGDPAIAGKKIFLNLVPHEVVGVAPRGFSFPLNNRTDVWAPQSARAIATDPNRGARGNQVLGLLHPNATWESARAEMNVIAARLAKQYPDDEGFGVGIVPMRDALTRGLRSPLLALLGALGMMMLLVCVNIANLLLVKLEARRRELAIRGALGASRARLIRCALMESLLLALAAGALGFALAPLGVRLLLAFVPPPQIPWLSVSTDMTMLLTSAGLAGAVTMIAGLLPAWRSTRLDLSSALAPGAWASTAAGTSRRLRHAFVVAQLALSLMLVVGAALLVQTLIGLQNVHPGFTPEYRMTLSYTAPRARYPDIPKLADLAERIREEISHVPGVVAAGAAQTLPFAESASWFQGFSRTDPRGLANVAVVPHVHYNVVSTGYAEALGLPLQAGRTFDTQDAASAPPVVIINEALAKRYFPNENPIGQYLWVGHAPTLQSEIRRTVVGVVGDARWDGLDMPAVPEAWVPIAQQPGGDMVLRTAFVIIQTTGDPQSHIAAVRTRIKQVDKDLALTSVRTLESRLDESIWRQRLAAVALGGLGLGALTIALLGVFGITSYLVGRRAHEMGVRLAMGAGPREIVRLVMAESGWLVLFGVVLGVAGAFSLARYLSTLLYGVTASDPATFLIAALGLSSAALLASYLPARRAANVDPLVTLRLE